MLDTFKARLKAKYPKINFTEKRIDTIAAKLHKRNPDVADDAAHDTAIDNLYDEESLAEMVRLDEVLAVKPKEEKKDDKKADEEKKDDPDMPAWFKSYKEENDKRFSELQVKDEQQSIKDKLKSELKDVPEKFWAKRVQPTKPEEIEAFVTDVNTDFKEFAPAETYVPGKSIPKPSNGKLNEKLINNIVDQAMNVQPQQTN